MKRKLKLNSLKFEIIITCIVAILAIALIVLSLVVNHSHINKENAITPDIKHEESLEDETKLEEEQDGVTPEFIYLGEFKLTAYCNCSECCGKWAGGATASGVMPTVNHTIAVDTSVIPFGTEIIIDGIDGVVFTAEDTGSAIIGNKIDIYMNSHEEALEFGVQYKDVYILKQ